MKIHEYQAKRIFEEFGIPTTPGDVATTPAEAQALADKLGGRVVIKAQVHVGGRGKAGGVKLAQNGVVANETARKILGMNIKGLIVKKVLVAKAIDIQSEAYLGITLDRGSRNICLIGTSRGGVEIEELAKSDPDAIIKMRIDPSLPVPDGTLEEMAGKIYANNEKADRCVRILDSLYSLFLKKDCTLAEINPLVVTGEGELVAADSKINIDDNALYRHPELAELRDLEQENRKEIEAKKYGLSFVDLDGNIGCMVNGAGLAMATMDMIKAAGGQPANFLDVGGSSNPEKVLRALEIILSNKNVKAIVINIFGGITRCDDIARGILEAISSGNIPVPVCVRLTGTNQEEAANILKNTNLITAETMDGVIEKAVALVCS